MQINKNKIILIALLIFSFFLRFYKLSDYPIQLNHDEVSQLYDTYSIIKTGKDIYGNKLPLAFPSTGDYKVGHYIYISTIPVWLFGDREFAIRIPSAFFGTLTVLAVFLFVNVLIKNWTIATLATFLVAILPSEIFYSRKSFEGEIGVCLEFFGLFCLVNFSKNKLWTFLGIFLMSLSMYVYTSFTMTIPLILIYLIFQFRNEINRRQLFYIFLSWFIFIIPLILISLTNPDIRFRAATVFVNQDINFGRALMITNNIFKSYLDVTFFKFLSQFNPTYLFINGLDLTNQGILGIGPLLLFQFPLVILGIAFLLRDKLYLRVRNLLFILAVISIIPSALTFEEYSPHRAMPAFVIFSIVSAFGLYWLILLIKRRILSFGLRTLIYGLLSLFIIFNFIYFLRIYTQSYTFEKPEKIQYPFKQVALYAWSQYNNFDTIIFDPKFGKTAPMIGVGSQYYFAYYGNYSPEKLQKELKMNPEKRGMAFDKFSIREVYWPKDKDLKNTLLIVSPWTLPLSDVNENSVIKRFNFYDGELAFYAIKL